MNESIAMNESSLMDGESVCLDGHTVDIAFDFSFWLTVFTLCVGFCAIYKVIRIIECIQPIFELIKNLFCLLELSDRVLAVHS